jgi:hypothetical protein
MSNRDTTAVDMVFRNQRERNDGRLMLLEKRDQRGSTPRDSGQNVSIRGATVGVIQRNLRQSRPAFRDHVDHL